MAIGARKTGGFAGRKGAVINCKKSDRGFPAFQRSLKQVSHRYRDRRCVSSRKISGTGSHRRFLEKGARASYCFPAGRCSNGPCMYGCLCGPARSTRSTRTSLLDWYDDFTELLLEMADRAGIVPTLRKDRKTSVRSGWLLRRHRPWRHSYIRTCDRQVRRRAARASNEAKDASGKTRTTK